MNEKRFYWIKLKTDFFNRNDIDFLLSQQNGCQYVVLYQMLCLNTANNEGKLSNQIGEVIVPYNVEKIVRDCKYFDFDTVTIALELFKKLGLVYELDNKTLIISNYDEMVGSETKWAEQKRIYREKQTLLRQDNGQELDNVQQEKDIRNKSIDNRDNIIEKEKDIDIEIITNRNDNNKLKDRDLEFEFEQLWKLYPRKVSKKKALGYYKTSRKKGTTFEEVEEGIYNYLDYIKQSKIEPDYIKHGSTWFNQECWNDEYLVKRKKSLKDLSMAEIEEAYIREKEGVNDIR